MKNNTIAFQKSGYSTIIILFFFFVCFTDTTLARDIYQLKIYSIETEQQEILMDKYLSEAYLPAMHRAGINHVGVFKQKEKSDSLQLIFVLTPFSSISQFEQIESVLKNDSKYQKEGNAYIQAAHDSPPYKRIESILLRSFEAMPEYGVPTHGNPASERIYELRSYQGATEKLYQKKVEMFNEAGETQLFIDLGFQPIFFGEVISGADMPNLMYFTTFKNKASQDELWQSFRDSPEWNEMKADKQYKNTVSHIDKYLLYPTDYSEL